MSDFTDALADPVPYWTRSWLDYLGNNPRVSGATSLMLLGQQGRQKLSRGDRERLAQGLYAETVRLSSAQASLRTFDNRAWMVAADLADEAVNPTKRITEYILPPYGQTGPDSWDPDAWELRASRLSASARNYALLIEALFQFTDEDRELICRRIFAGTSFAATADDAERCERLATQLDALVAQTDKLLGRVIPGVTLTHLFERTAHAKADMLRAGCADSSWPLFETSEVRLPGGQLPDPYWDFGNDFAYRTINPADPGYRYMLRPALAWLDALMHLPRAYLGCVSCLPDWIDVPQANFQKVGKLMADLHHFQSTLIEERLLASRETRFGETRWRVDRGTAVASLDQDHARADRDIGGEGHCWLVIYPAHRGRGLCPLLYWSLGEGGVHVCHLDRHSMHAMLHLHMPGEQGVITVAERIAQMLDDPRRSLAQEWARTVFDLQDNPILARERLRG